MEQATAPGHSSNLALEVAQDFREVGGLRLRRIENDVPPRKRNDFLPGMSVPKELLDLRPLSR